MITGSEGVSFLLPQLFLSQHRLWEQQQTVVLMHLPSSYARLVIFFFLKSDSKAVGAEEISHPTKRFGTFKPSEFTCCAAQLAM